MNISTPDMKQSDLKDMLSRFDNIVYNLSMTRAAFFSEVLEKRAKVDSACGWPALGSQIPIDTYRNLYDRFSIANRCVNIWPREAWQVQPKVFENEEHQQTEFEQAWQELCASVAGVIGGGPNYYQDALGSGMWEYMARGDELSGIGTFGIILLAFADGKLFEQPVDGSPPDGNPYTVPNLASSGMPDGARVIPGAFGGQAGVDYIPTTGPGNVSDQFKSIYGNPQPEQMLGGAASPLAPGQINPLTSTLGTDAQYRGMQFTPGYYPNGDSYSALDPYAGVGNPREILAGGVPVGYTNGKAKKPKNSLMFMRVFDESLVQVVQYEADLRNPRFGQPVMYLVTLNDPRYPHTGIGLPMATVRVHWSRIIHLSDVFSVRSTSEIFSLPRMQPVFNNLLDLRKLYGGSAEMYWQGALPGLSLETHPQLGGDVKVDIPQMQEMMRQYTEGLERWLQMSGMSVHTLAPTVVDPSNQIQTQIDAICIQLTVPKRVFMGAERGELASTQDDANWNDRVRHRQSIYITPRIICPVVNRLINLGVLPRPEGYSVKWPDLDSQTEATKATIAVQKVQAIASFTGGMPESIMTPMDFYVRIMGHDEETAKQIIEQAQLQQAMMQMATTPSGGMEQPQQQASQPTPEGPGSSESELVTHSLPWRPPWTRESIQPILNTLHMGGVPNKLVGSVAIKGMSHHDADILVQHPIDKELVNKLLSEHGLEPSGYSLVSPEESNQTRKRVSKGRWNAIHHYENPHTRHKLDLWETLPEEHTLNASTPDLLVTHSDFRVNRIKRALEGLSEDDLDGLVVWYNKDTNEVIIDSMDWHNGKGAKIIDRVARRAFGKKKVKHQNEGGKPQGEDWISLTKGMANTANASTPNVKGGQIGSKTTPIGAYKVTLSQDTEGGKWQTVVSSINPAIVHHIPVGIALEKGTEAGRLRGPQIGPMGQVIESTGKTRVGHPTGKRATGG